MSIEELIERYPRLYHMAEAESWQSIRREGLLSTSALLDLYEISGPERETLEALHRPEKVTISHSTRGEAVLRDQKPMSNASLSGCLEDGLAPTDWYRLLNGKVFFWLSRPRLLKLLGARAYRNDEHDVLTLDTASLINRHAAAISLCPINSGTSIPWKHPRGLSTFRPISAYPFDDRRKYGENAIVELTVEYAVSDISDHVLSVDRMSGNQLLGNIFAGR